MLAIRKATATTSTSSTPYFSDERRAACSAQRFFFISLSLCPELQISRANCMCLEPVCERESDARKAAMQRRDDGHTGSSDIRALAPVRSMRLYAYHHLCTQNDSAFCFSSISCAGRFSFASSSGSAPMRSNLGITYFVSQHYYFDFRFCFLVVRSRFARGPNVGNYCLCFASDGAR